MTGKKAIAKIMEIAKDHITMPCKKCKNNVVHCNPPGLMVIPYDHKWIGSTQLDVDYEETIYICSKFEPKEEK